MWTVVAAGKTFRVRTNSARTALDHARKRTGEEGELVELGVEEAPVVRPSVGSTRHRRRRRVLMPEAIRRRNSGETVADIARALQVPRETVRDWLSAASP